MSRIENDAEMQEALRGARTMIQDLANGWPVRELHCTPAEMIEQITEALDDAEDYAAETNMEEIT